MSKKENKIKYEFKRVELKYILKIEQYNKILSFVEEHFLQSDFHIQDNCSIYYDTPDFYCIRHTSKDKGSFTQKIRLRAYGLPNDNSKVFIELKRKSNSIIYKRRASMLYSEAKKKYLMEKILI